MRDEADDQRDLPRPQRRNPALLPPGGISYGLVSSVQTSFIAAYASALRARTGREAEQVSAATEGARPYPDPSLDRSPRCS
jgi:hypothetical protein